MAKPKKKKKQNESAKKKPTSARLLKNRPVDPEPLENEGASEEPENESEHPGEPLQQRLPEMEDPAIEEIEAAAEHYATIRDKRMSYTEQEVECKENLLGIMQKHGKETYRHAGIEVRVVKEVATVKVKIHKDE